MAAAKSARAKKRVLIAEDDPDIARLLERALSKKYSVTLVDDGFGAVAAATKPPEPHLILLDVMMPGLDGFAVVERLKLFPRVARVPVIFLTARDDPKAAIAGIQRGARHYITKPFRLTDVLDKVSRLLGE